MSAEADLELVRSLAGAALASLEASRGRIDDLNVYPVPDGDTGTNLTLTVRAVADRLNRPSPWTGRRLRTRWRGRRSWERGATPA